MGIKQPPAYLHPKKNAGPDQSLKQQTTARVQPSVSPVKKKESQRARLNELTKQAPKPSEQPKELIRLVACPPAAGQIARYDEMIDHGLTPKQAILGLFKQGFDTLETDLLAGRISPLKNSIVSNGNAVETTRTVTREFIQLAKSHFDPFDVLSNRALGQCIGEHILYQVAKRGGDG
ncbi:MAG: hypothetical protein WBD01_07935 [Salaquimonas sp.]